MLYSAVAQRHTQCVRVSIGKAHASVHEVFGKAVRGCGDAGRAGETWVCGSLMWHAQSARTCPAHTCWAARLHTSQPHGAWTWVGEGRAAGVRGEREGHGQGPGAICCMCPVPACTTRLSQATTGCRSTPLPHAWMVDKQHWPGWLSPVVQVEIRQARHALQLTTSTSFMASCDASSHALSSWSPPPPLHSRKRLAQLARGRVPHTQRLIRHGQQQAVIVRPAGASRIG